MMVSATFTLSALSRNTMALSWSLAATFLAPTRLRNMVITSLTSALERKNVWMTRSS
jgi:hypothetical protein